MKRAERNLENRISRLYGLRCSGIQIDILDIGKVFETARKAAAEGLDDQKLGDRIVAYVETIRHN